MRAIQQNDCLTIPNKSLVRHLAVFLVAMAVAFACALLWAPAPQTWADSGEPTSSENSELNKYVTGLNAHGRALAGTTLSLSEDPAAISYRVYGAASGRYVQWELYSGSSLVSKQTATDTNKTFAVPNDAAGKTVVLRVFDSPGGSDNYSVPIPVVTDFDILSGPSVSNIKYNGPFLKKNIYVNLSGRGSYKFKTGDTSTRYVYDTKIKLTVNGAVVGTKTATYPENQAVFTGVALTVNKTTTVKAALYMDIEGELVEGPVASYTIPAEGIGKTTVYATKISKKQAVVRWSYADGATGYFVYQGSKKVKTVGASTNKVTIKRKGAGKAKFKVIPFTKQGGKIYKGTSNVAKPKSNQITFGISISYNSASYMTCPFRIKKISLSGKTYTITGYAVNNRIFKMKKYRKLGVGLTVDGKKAFSKIFKNKAVNVKPSSSKKIVLKVKGKAGVDLRYGVLGRTISFDPMWVYSSGRPIKN